MTGGCGGGSYRRSQYRLTDTTLSRDDEERIWVLKIAHIEFQLAPPVG